jgi:hypothetical protein
MSKRELSLEEIEAQTAIELPDRAMMALVNIAIFDIANNPVIQIPITVQNNHIAAEVCAQVSALSSTLPGGYHLTCTTGA